jgi:hypothetical protein
MYYYNAPNYNPNLIFQGTHDEHQRLDKHTHENPVYRLQSKFTKRNRKNNNKTKNLLL